MSKWKLLRIDQIGTLKSGATPDTTIGKYWSGKIGWITPSDLSKLKSRFIHQSERAITRKGLESCSATLMPGGKSIVISSRAPIGYIAIPTVDFTTNQGCKSIVLDDNQDPDFHYYNLSHNVNKIKGRGEGTTFAEISKAELEKLEFNVPPLPTQRKIARILSTIDGQIEKTEAIIAKYQAVKQGILQDLFTRGIDVRTGELRPRYEDAPELYQQSALGMIPKEWEVKKLKDISEFITSGSRGWAGYYAEEGALFIRIGNLTREHINLRFGDVKRVKLSENNEGKRTLLIANDILISITADLGIIGVIPDNFEEAYINQHIALVRVAGQYINPRFIGHFLAGEISQKSITMLNDSGAKAGLNLPTIANLLFISPGLEEQNKSAKIIDNQDDTIAINKRNLSKLQLLKQGLMQDLLSGKVSVSE